MRDLMLVRAIIIHRPDLLVSAPVADEINLRLGNAGNACAQPKDDFVGELVGHQSRRSIAGRIGILLAQNLWGLRIFHIIEPALDGQLPRRDSQASESQHGCVGRRRVPREVVHLRRLTGNLQRIKALRNQFDDPGDVEIVPQRVVESLEQSGILRIGG